MKTTEIQVGKRYRNKSGNTERRVISIGKEKAEWYSDNPRPDEPGVYFEQVKGAYAGSTLCLFLSSFARWAFSEASEKEG